MATRAPERRPVKLHVKKGDTVLVLSGKDKGKRGKVLRALPREGRVVVEGVHVVKKHVKPNRKVMQGGIIAQEAPLHAAKVMLVCPKCNTPTRIARRRLADGKSVRACRRCGEIVDR